MEKSGQLHALATLPPGKNPCTLWIRGWMVPQPVWTFQRREKSHISTMAQNPYLAACSIVTIAHSFTQCTKTRNQNTLQSPVRIMYCTQSAVMPTVLGGTWRFFYWIRLSCGLYLELFVSSAHTCTIQHYGITVISLIYQKVDKRTSQQLVLNVCHTSRLTAVHDSLQAHTYTWLVMTTLARDYVLLRAL